MEESDNCYHCGEDLAGSELRAGTHAFCCGGCLGAFQIIEAAGRSGYYTHRTKFSPRPDDAADPSLAVFEAALTPEADGALKATFLVRGIRCASCVWLTELALGDLEGVDDVEVRFATGRAYLRWQPRQVSLSEIAAATAALGYRLVPLEQTGEGGVQRQGRTFLQQMTVAGFFAGNTMLLSVALYAGYFDHIDQATKNLLHLFSFLFCLPVLLYSARPIFRGAWAAVLYRTPTMDVLTALGIALAFFYSVFAWWSQRGEVFFDSITFVVFILLIGRFVEDRLKARMLFFVENLSPALTGVASVYRDDRWQSVATKDVVVGDRLMLGSGEFVPVDGRVLSESAEIETAILTGEFLPRVVPLGQVIVAGSRNIGPPLELLALSDQAGGMLGHITALADSSMREQPRFVRTAERASRWFVAFVLLAGCATFAFWYGRGVEFAILNTLTLLIAACPCALNLAIPTVYTTALQRAFASGCLLRTGTLLETLARTSTIVFDKTGTLSKGQLRVAGIQTFKNASEQQARDLAVALQSANTVRHPVTEAFLRLGPVEQCLMAADVEYEPGSGLRGSFGGIEYALGSIAFLRDLGFAIPDTVSPEMATAGLSAAGPHPGANPVDGREVLLPQLQVALGRTTNRGPELLAVFFLEDELRPEAVTVLSELRAARRLLLVSGDTSTNANWVGRQLAFDQVLAPCSPAEKARIISRLQREGDTVVMVGDGINDAAALRTSDCGISFAGASDASVVRADVVLIDADLNRLVELFDLAGRARRKVRQNLALSFLYNAALLPLAFSGVIVPIVAAGFMALSSITVLLNSLALRGRPSSTLRRLGNSLDRPFLKSAGPESQHSPNDAIKPSLG